MANVRFANTREENAAIRCCVGGPTLYVVDVVQYLVKDSVNVGEVGLKLVSAKVGVCGLTDFVLVLCHEPVQLLELPLAIPDVLCATTLEGSLENGDLSIDFGRV